jgi:hypothetical protein
VCGSGCLLELGAAKKREEERRRVKYGGGVYSVVGQIGDL